MPAATTGQKSAISFVTSALTLVVTSIKPAGYSVDDIERPHLGLNVGDCTPMDPADLAKPGVIEVEYEDDESVTLHTQLRVRQNVVITYRPPAGLTNGATETYALAYIKSFEPSVLQSNQRRLGKMMVQVNGFPTKAAAS